jgi:hypothetical protein
MTLQAVDVTGQSLSHAVKRLKKTAFCFLYSLQHQAVGNNRTLASHSRQAVKDDRVQK